MPLQTNLIAYSSHATEVKEWFYYLEPSASSKTGGKAAGQSEDGRAGPITKDELRMYYAQNKVIFRFQHRIPLPEVVDRMRKGIEVLAFGMVRDAQPSFRILNMCF